jgi:lipid A ethanolaminephosphotransferase
VTGPVLRISHTRFVLGFPALLYVVCNALNIGTLAQWFHERGGLNLWGLSAYLVAGLCLFIAFVALLAHRWTIKPLAILLIVLSAAATYFISKYHVAIDASMVRNTIHTDPTEVGQLLSLHMVPYLLFLVLLPVALLLRLDITFRPSGRYLFASLQVMGVVLGIAFACLYLNYSAVFRAGNVSKKYIVYSLVPINLISSSLGVAAREAEPYLSSRRKAVDPAGRVSTPGNLIVVLAIGESSRRKSFSLYGYSRRNTNPVLGTVQGLHLLNAVARRGSTLYALPQILEKQHVKLPAMVARAGIRTSCFVNYTLYDNCGGVGETGVGPCGHDGHCFDEDVIPLLESRLAAYRSGYEFVVLHLGGGSHGPVYGDRHPPEFLRFKPTCDHADVASQCTIEQLYNSYDNSILYVDHVVGALLKSLDHSGAPYVFLYLSDHGESLLENGVMFHGMPPGMALPQEQAQIPLIVKTSIPVSIVARDEYEQGDVFDTVLDLFSIQSPMFDHARSFIRK